MPPGSPRYSIAGRQHVEDWMARTEDPDRRYALMVWCKAICRDPDWFTTSSYRHATSNREFRYSDVPNARTRVTFVVFETPTPMVSIVRISDDDFEPSPTLPDIDPGEVDDDDQW